MVWRHRPKSARARLLSTVRSHDFAAHSDEELRAALAGVRAGAGRGRHDGALGLVFSLVDEALRRRLGTWRAFDPEIDHPWLEAYRAVASRIVASGPYRSHVGYYTDDAFLDSPEFHGSLGPLLREFELDPEGRAIVAAMVCVEEKSKVTYTGHILLSARPYRAMAAKDLEGALAFRATDEQLLAGLLLYEGRIVEMNAGEGKTIAAAFPAVMHVASGRRVHVITANDYLASRDAEWLAPVYESLGVTVRAVLGHMSDPERREAYEADVVYGTVRELGFDFLRDNLRFSRRDMVQGTLDVAIVDEADQVLIDESHTPLIISGGATGNLRALHKTKAAVEELAALQGAIVSALETDLRLPGYRRGPPKRPAGATSPCRPPQRAPARAARTGRQAARSGALHGPLRSIARWPTRGPDRRAVLPRGRRARTGHADRPRAGAAGGPPGAALRHGAPGGGHPTDRVRSRDATRPAERGRRKADAAALPGSKAR